MAYPVGVETTTSPDGDTSGSLVIMLPTGVIEDDLIVLEVTNDNGGTTLAVSGYTEVTGTAQVAARGTRSATFHKIAGSSESNPTVTGATTGFAVTAKAWRDVNTVTPIDIAAQTDQTTASNTVSSPSVTPTNDDGLVVRWCGGWDGGDGLCMVAPPFLFVARAQGSSVTNLSTEVGQSTAAATGTHLWEWTSSDGGSAYTYVINNKSGGTPPIISVGGITPIRRYGEYGSVFETTTFTTLFSSVTSIGGISVSSGAVVNVDDQRAMANAPYEFASEIENNLGGTFWIGGTHTITSTDFSGKLASATISVPQLGLTGADGALFMMFDGSGNWSAYNIPLVELGSNYFGNTVFASETGPVYDSSGTLDWTDIVKVGYAWHKDSTSTTQRGVTVRDFFLLDLGILSGGGVDHPITPARLPAYFSPDVAIGQANLQATGQALIKRSLTLGDGTNDVYWVASTQSLELPPRGTNDWRVSDLDITYTINATANSTIDFSASIVASDTQQNFVFDASTSASATYNFAGMALIGYVVTWNSGVTANTISFINCGIIDAKAATFTACIVNDNTSVTHAMHIDVGAVIECAFTRNVEAHAIEISILGAYDLSDSSFTGYTKDLNITAASGTVTITLQSGQPQPTFDTAGATVVFVQPTVSFTINSNESGSLIEIFTTTTQTLLASTTGTTLAYTHSSETVDYSVMKSGFKPQRFTARTLSGTEVVDVNLESDPVYDAAHGLVYTTDASWSRSLNELTIPTFAPSIRNVYSLMIDSFISESTLRNTAFNMQMNGPNSMFLIEDAEGATDGDIENLTDGGVRYVSSADAVTAEWSAVLSIGVATGFTGEYQQQDGTGTTDARATGVFDELIKSFGDSGHGNFDFRGHLVLKYQVNGFREVRVDVLDTYGISALEPTLYVIAMAPVAINAATGDPAISLTITDHGAGPVTWNSKQFSITVLDSGANSGVNVLREINFNLSLDATFQGKDPFNWPEMVKELGSDFDTLRGITEGGVGVTLKGVRVIRTGDVPHPDFTRFQSDDGTFFTPAVTANAQVSNIINASRMRIFNQTTATETFNGVPGTGFSLSYTDGTTYSSGDVVVVTITEQSTVTASLEFTGVAVATSQGWSVIATQEADTIYAQYAIDGSTITKFAADYVDDELDLIVGANFAGTEFYSWWTFNTTTEQGIRQFFGVVTAQDEANIRINSSTLNLLWDNNTANNVIQTDNIRIYREDEVYPVKNPTTGGGGIDVVWRNRVFVAETGTSGLTPSESAQLGVITTVDSKVDDMQGTGFDTNTDSLEQIRDNQGGGGGGDATEANQTQILSDIAALRDYDPETDTVEGSETYAEAQRLIRSEAAGKVRVSGNNVIFRDAADSKDRITASTDKDGQRLSVTVDGS